MTNKEKRQIIDTNIKEIGIIITTLRCEELISQNTYDSIYAKTKTIASNLPSLLDVVTEVWENAPKMTDNSQLATTRELKKVASLVIADYTIEVRKR